MLRRALAVLMLAAALLASSAHADDIKKLKESSDRLQLRQVRHAQEFTKAKRTILRMAQSCESSSDPDMKKKAEVLVKAMDKITKEGMEVDFDKHVNTLKDFRLRDVKQLDEAIAQNKHLMKQLDALIYLLIHGEEPPPPPPPPSPGEDPPGIPPPPPPPLLPEEPGPDDYIVEGEAPGEVEDKELKKIGEAWGKLPAKERVKFQHGLLRRLPTAQRDVARQYLERLGQ